jgi:hypothetical protein
MNTTGCGTQAVVHSCGLASNHTGRSCRVKPQGHSCRRAHRREPTQGGILTRVGADLFHPPLTVFSNPPGQVNTELSSLGYAGGGGGGGAEGVKEPLSPREAVDDDVTTAEAADSVLGENGVVVGTMEDRTATTMKSEDVRPTRPQTLGAEWRTKSAGGNTSSSLTQACLSLL